MSNEAIRAHEIAVHQALTSFRKIVSATRRHFELVQARCGISGAELWALWQVEAEPGLRVSDLARHLFIHQSTASNLLNKLVKAGMVERRRAGLDQRVVRIFPTEAGRRLLRHAPQPARGIVSDAVEQLTPAALNKLNTALRVLLSKMQTGDKKAAKQTLSDLLR